MRSLLAEKWQGRKIGFVDLEEREIGLFVLAQEAGFQNPALSDRDLAGRIAHGQRQGDANALCAFHHVRIGHDVAVGVYNHARADRVLAYDERGLGTIFFAERPVPGNENLHDGGGDLGGEALQSSVELDQDAGRVIWFRFDRFRVDAFLGRLLGRRLLAGLRPGAPNDCKANHQN